VAESVAVEGVAQLRRTLKAAGEDVTQFNALNKRVGNVVVTRAKLLVPTGPEIGGHIRNTIRAGASRTAAVVKVGNAKFPYGPPLHWGWPSRGIPAQPFVTDAAQQTESQWLEIYWDGLNKIIESIKGA
jgi:hypothetical protein